MNKIKITCDSTCDLTKDLYNKYAVHVVPMGISLGDELRYDGKDITIKELFQYVESSGQLPKTSAISVWEYETAFREYVEQGYQVIHISLSDELSSSHQNAVIASQEVGNVYVVDSRNLSSGSGHLVLIAGALAESGMSAEEIVKELNEKKAA